MKRPMAAALLILGAGMTLRGEGMTNPMGPIPLGNVAGSTGMVFPEGKARLVIKRMSLKKDKAYDGDDEVPDPMKRRMDVDVTHLLFRYGLGHGWDVRAALNYVEKKSAMTIPAGPLAGRRFEIDDEGIGDSMVVFRYGVFNQMKGDPLFLSVGAGLKIPTGDTDKSFRTPMGTNPLLDTQPMQLGTGSWDGIFEIGATRLLPRSRIDAHALYLLRGEGDYGYVFGDTLKWNLGYSYALNRSWGLHLEIDGIHMRKNSQNGRSIEHSGGNFIYLTPGISWRMGKSMDLSVGYSRMIHRDNHYNTLAAVGGLSENHRLFLRLGVNF